jgi:peroxiredoxin Q/BCP
MKEKWHPTKLKEGDNAPGFTCIDQNGQKVSLSDYKEKKVILYFYPKDDTSGCTAEACDLRDHYPVITDKKAVVIGVSADNEKSHKKFADKYNLPFTLLADTDKKVINSYGVWGEKSFLGKKYMGIMRTTFLIDAEGKIEKIFKDVDTKHHTNQIFSLE